MNEKKVLQFSQNDEFYYKVGRECLENGEIIKSVKYLNKALSLVKAKSNFLAETYYLMLAQAYGIAGNYDMSNYYYFMSLQSEIFSQIAYRGLGENFYALNDIVLARFYLNNCINLIDSSPIALSARQRLQDIDGEHKGFRVIKNDDKDFLLERKISQAEVYMSKGKFEKAIDIFEDVADFSDPRIRSELALAYFFVNDVERGKNLIKTFGEETSLDLCNLLLIYFCENNVGEMDRIVAKLRNLPIESKADYFKIGLTFAQVGKLNLAKDYMERYLIETPYESEFEFLYCLTCINLKDFDTAKNKLLDLKTLDPFNSYIYDYYINLCDKKRIQKVEYLFNLPVKEYLKVQAKMKDLLVVADETLKNEFLKNQDFYYYISLLPQGNTKNLLLLKLARIEGKKINDFFNFLLLSGNVETPLKNRLAIKRLSLESVNAINMTKDNVFVKILLPNKKATIAINENLSHAAIRAVEYLLNETLMLKINLKQIVIKLERKNLRKNVDEKILAAMITWLAVSAQKQGSLRNICSYFGVSESDFFEFADLYEIEV